MKTYHNLAGEIFQAIQFLPDQERVNEIENMPEVKKHYDKLLMEGEGDEATLTFLWSDGTKVGYIKAYNWFVFKDGNLRTWYMDEDFRNKFVESQTK